MPVLSVVFGTVSMVGGILIALGGSLPISPYVTTISFAIYVVCRIAGTRRMRRGWAPRRRLPVNQDAANQDAGKQDAGKQQNGRTTPVETGVVRPS